MNSLDISGNWDQQKGKLKQRFAMLTDNDLLLENGKKDELYGKLEIKLGKTKEELQRILDAL